MECSTNNFKREVVVDVVQGDHNVSNKCTKSISNDLHDYKFSDDIKIRANYIYSNMNSSTRRAHKRKLLLFFCVYSAYKELSIKVNPSDLGKIFDLTDGEMKKTQSMFSFLQTGYKPVCRTISIYDYVPDFCYKLGLEQYTDDIILLYENVITKDKELLQQVRQTLSAGFLKYFLIINGIELNDKNELSRVTQRSDTTIDTMYKKICEIDNRPMVIL